jgi:UDP-glucose 4-epimerase
MDLKQASRIFGLRYSVVRPHNVFGVYQNIWDKYRNVLGIWIRQTLSGQPITVYGDGLQIRSFSDVSYYMEPFEKLTRLGDGETYNMGADEHTSIISAAHRFQYVAKTLGHDVSVAHLSPRDEVRVAYCDHAKAKSQLDFVDATNFDVLIEKMFRWASSVPPRPVKTMPYEVQKNMYDFWLK